VSHLFYEQQCYSHYPTDDLLLIKGPEEISTYIRK
jgi:hypothetical protein